MNATDQYSEGFAENDGVKIFYRDYGPINGDPILMVHGLGAQLVHWPRPCLADRGGRGPVPLWRARQ